MGVLATMVRPLALALIVVAGAACSAGETAAPSPERAGTQAPPVPKSPQQTPRPTPPPAAPDASSPPPPAEPPPPPEFASRDVEIPTDGAPLAATFWDLPGERAPGVVLVAEADADRSVWRDVAPHFLRRGVCVVAIDRRGRARGAAAADDVLAGARWLVTAGWCDVRRIAAVGACDGAAAAIEAARRADGAVAAVVCLTPPGPGADGLPAAVDLTWPSTRPLLLVAHREDAEDAESARDTHPGARLLLVGDDQTDAIAEESGWYRGTRMFDRVAMVEQTMASFVAARTGSARDDVVLDGVLDDETEPGGAWTRAAHLAPADGVEGWAYLANGRVEFAVRSRADGDDVDLELRPSVEGTDARGRRVAGLDGPRSSPLRLRIELATGRVTKASSGEGWASPGGCAPPAAGFATAPVRFVLRRDGAFVSIEGEAVVALPPGARATSVTAALHTVQDVAQEAALRDAVRKATADLEGREHFEARWEAERRLRREFVPGEAVLEPR